MFRYRIEVLGLGFERRQFLKIQERADELKFVLTQDEGHARLFPTKEEARQVAQLFSESLDHFTRVAPVFSANI